MKVQSGGRGARVEPRVLRREITAANWVVRSMRGVCSTTSTGGGRGFGAGTGEDRPEVGELDLVALI